MKNEERTKNNIKILQGKLNIEYQNPFKPEITLVHLIYH